MVYAEVRRECQILLELEIQAIVDQLMWALGKDPVLQEQPVITTAEPSL